MTRYLPLLALALPLALAGCNGDDDRTETIDLERETPAQSTEDLGTGTEADDSGGAEDPSNTYSGDDISAEEELYGEPTPMGDTEGPPEMGDTSEVETCSEQWFVWLHEKVLAMPGKRDQLNERYPDGIPEPGSDEWFVAMDTATGGDGAHGPDGGSDEWCSMMEKRFDSMPD